MPVSQEVAQRILATYRERTARSRAFSEEANATLAGGLTRNSVYFSPYPSFITEGKGARITDLDGNVLIDFLNNFTSLLHGHAYGPVVEAVSRQMARGSAFGAPSELEVRLAQLIQERVPSMERIRFASSGSEAVMYALRLARAFTKRRKIAKFEGGFHGAYDLAQVSVGPALAAAGPADAPHGVPASEGIPADWKDDVVVLPYNDIVAVERIVEQHKNELAALIVEPIMGVGGFVAARPGFLAALREITRKHGILLIFDEIVSLRLAPGGAQSLEKTVPDLTTVGKIIAGGLPMAAFGGRTDIMDLVIPRGRPAPVAQSGTFTGAAVCCAAGLAGYGAFTPDSLAHIDQLGEDLRRRSNALFERLSVDAQTIGTGSLFNIHFTRESIVSYREIARSDKERLTLLSLALLNRGVFLTARGQGSISTVMTKADVDAFLIALEGALNDIQGA